MKECRFSISVNRKECANPHYHFLRIRVGKKLLPGTCHATSKALYTTQRLLGKLFRCRVPRPKQ